MEICSSKEEEVKVKVRVVVVVGIYSSMEGTMV